MTAAPTRPELADRLDAIRPLLASVPEHRLRHVERAIERLAELLALVAEPSPSGD